MLSQLSQIIIQQISEYLDNKSLVALFRTSKTNNYFLDNNYTWKKKLLTEYSRVFYWKSNLNLKKKYIYTLKNLCVSCNKKTKKYNEFFHRQVCRECETNVSRYKMVTMTHVKTNYYLTDKDLVYIKFIRRNNSYNSKKKLKLFLKTDIVRYISKKYSLREYQAIRKNREDKKVMKNVETVSRFHLVNSMLFNIYNVNIQTLLHNILPDINDYSDRNYVKFIKGSKNETVFKEIIEQCLELEFIHKYTVLDWSCFYNFEELLLFFLLSDSFNLPLINNYHISGLIEECFRENKEKFHRKKMVIEFFQNSPNCVSDYLNNKNVREFIYHGKEFYNSSHVVNKLDENNYIYGGKYDDRSVIKRLYIFYTLENFLYNNTDISSVILNGMISMEKISRFCIYKKCLKNYTGDVIVPKILVENFLIM